jgi:Lon protease-like protein
VSELPLFPLSSVLLPFGRMPLQIYEQRYLDLVRDCMKSDTPFGVVWIRRGSEVVQRGQAAPDLGDFGTCARIVDWDQLSNGLLGITIEGAERFELLETSIRANGLVEGQVQHQPVLNAAAIAEAWRPMVDMLRSLETHPHVQRMNLRVDYNDAWQVGYTLIQLLPLEEAVKYEMFCLENIEELMAELDVILNQISGEDSH